MATISSKKMIKKWDIILIVVMIIISFIPEVIFFTNGEREYNSKYIEIEVNSRIDKKIPLLDSDKEQVIDIKSKDGVNTIKIVNGEVTMIEADCDDKVCINFGSISKVGQSIVCLPHKVVISIKGEESSSDDMILSY